MTMWNRVQRPALPAQAMDGIEAAAAVVAAAPLRGGMVMDTTADYFTLPVGLLAAREYRRLQNLDKLFLIALYALHGDCERFQIDTSDPVRYFGKDIVKYEFTRKISVLVQSGLIRAVGSAQWGPTRRQRRVFEFFYPTRGRV
jgi:hypothetical protein